MSTGRRLREHGEVLDLVYGYEIKTAKLAGSDSRWYTNIRCPELGVVASAVSSDQVLAKRAHDRAHDRALELVEDRRNRRGKYAPKEDGVSVCRCSCGCDSVHSDPYGSLCRACLVGDC